MNEQIAAFAELANELLVADQIDELVEQLADPDLADEWDDSQMVAAVGEAYGRHAAAGRLLDVAVLRSGDHSLLLPPPGAGTTAARHKGEEIEVHGVVRGSFAGRVAVMVDDQVWSVPADALVVRPVAGLDPSAGLHLVEGRVGTGDAELLAVDAETTVSRTARFLAHELLGTAESALAMAADHVRARHQFGVPIGSFQAVRHRLADAHVLVTAARELLAAYPADAGRDVHLLVLKASAGAAAHQAVAAAQQVCGGMGFTEEFGLHRFVRRALLLDGLLGGWEDAEALLGRLAVGDQVIPDRQVVLS